VTIVVAVIVIVVASVILAPRHAAKN
jgi:hypothetical protein